MMRNLIDIQNFKKWRNTLETLNVMIITRKVLLEIK